MCFYDLFTGGASENGAMTDEIGEGYFFFFTYIGTVRIVPALELVPRVFCNESPFFFLFFLLFSFFPPLARYCEWWSE